jgi:beta-glucosidase
MSGLPGTFRFGAATAAYQIEGAVREDGRGESIWDRFSHTPGRVHNGDTGDVACDHYRRYREDLDLMAALGLELYRFSIAWPRIQPEGKGAPNRAGLDFYRRLVDGLLERGIEPMATLYHWDLPQALQDQGGWEHRDTAKRFAEYSALVFRQLGDSVRSWVTHNEPWVTAFEGYGYGTKAPGVRDWSRALAVAHNVLLSHGLAVRAFRELGPRSGEVGIALNLYPVYPATMQSEDRAAAYRFDGFMNRWFLDPIASGSYPPDMVGEYETRFGDLSFVRPGDLTTISAEIDFLGVNYYSRTLATTGADEPLGVHTPRGGLPITAMGWEVSPDSFYDLLVRLGRDYGWPVVITENGAAYDDSPPANGVVDDPERLNYFRRHLAAVERAVDAGVDVRGYCAWSLLDNFEWDRGYSKRFGIVYVDYKTQRRIPKQSALWYRDLIAARKRGRKAVDRG